jgi:hypothetical protein
MSSLLLKVIDYFSRHLRLIKRVSHLGLKRRSTFTLFRWSAYHATWLINLVSFFFSPPNGYTPLDMFSGLFFLLSLPPHAHPSSMSTMGGALWVHGCTSVHPLILQKKFLYDIHVPVKKPVHAWRARRRTADRSRSITSGLTDRDMVLSCAARPHEIVGIAWN